MARPSAMERESRFSAVPLMRSTMMAGGIIVSAQTT